MALACFRRSSSSTTSHGELLPGAQGGLFHDLETVLRPLADRPVTIRLLDMGGDKPLPSVRMRPESNPLLGKRSASSARLPAVGGDATQGSLEAFPTAGDTYPRPDDRSRT